MDVLPLQIFQSNDSKKVLEITFRFDVPTFKVVEGLRLAVKIKVQINILC